MKILHLNTHDAHGGAARAAQRIHRALLQADVESRMLVQIRSDDNPTVYGPVSNFAKALGYIRPHMEKFMLYSYSQKAETFFSPAFLPFSGVLKKIDKIKPDVIHLHWITGGFLRIEDLIRIRRPIVWTMHDMWTFTGGCHYDERCGGYVTGCGCCPKLGSSKQSDLSSRVFRRKMRVFNELRDLVAVGISRWLCQAAHESMLLKDNRIINIPNPIDTNHFRPFDKMAARDLLGLPPEKKIVLVGAMDVLQDARKGFPELCRALGRIQIPGVEVAVFGAGPSRAQPDFDFPVHYLGRLHDDFSLRAVYSAADVMIVPSLQENFSNIILESLACGTPVVAFRIGGNPDMIDHQSNGYLAEPFDPLDLAQGIDWVLNYPDPEALCENARRKVIDCFTPSLVAAQYMRLYEKIMTS